MIALIDYGGGNVGSVLKAIRYLGCPAGVVARPDELAAATKIILPGQGHFGAMMKALEDRAMLEPLRRMILPGDTCVAPSEGKPFHGNAGVPFASLRPCPERSEGAGPPARILSLALRMRASLPALHSTSPVWRPRSKTSQTSEGFEVMLKT